MKSHQTKLWINLVAAGVLLSLQGCGSTDPVDPVYDQDWYLENTVSRRSLVEVPAASDVLAAEAIKEQLTRYDPGNLLRCEVEQDEAYQAVIDQLGGVSWGYNVRVLDDQSRPMFRRGYHHGYPDAGAMPMPSEAVEIEEADIVGISASDALFHSTSHGLFMVDLTGQAPVFKCATKLPGRVEKFFFYQEHLVVMVGNQRWGKERQSFLLHFKVADRELRFLEAVELGNVSILDTRRFNDQLVIFTDLSIDDAEDPAGSSGAPGGWMEPMYSPQVNADHRTLRIFAIGDTLAETFQDTLIDTTQAEGYWTSHEVDPATPLGTVINESTSYGSQLWASDHYFVVTQSITKTQLSGWETNHYNVCTQSHDVTTTYTHCQTIYEEQPNPNYTPPDNSGGDRSCEGTTLADCLHQVSRASSKTIQVPVGKECEERTRTQWICDAWEQRSYTYPTFESTRFTTLFIYEYTDSGFIRLDSKVHEIVNQGLEQVSMDDQVETLTTSDEAYDLLIEGAVQTLRFQGGFLYVIAAGALQVYSMGDSSMVRTSSMALVNDQLETSLFTLDKIYLCDVGYNSNWTDRSTLKVVDLTNPAFPRQVSTSHQLPGGHSKILPTSRGILTIGSVQNFTQEISSVIKLGLFTDPFAEELAYLIIGTDLIRTNLGVDKSLYFDSAEERLFLPYSGYAEEHAGYLYRIGVSHLEADSIKSEGALEVPEQILRLRPLPGSEQQGLLSFAESSIAWLVQEQGQWKKEPVLEYFTPVALYRFSDDDDWVEVLKLGNQCMLHLAKKRELNTRDSGITTEVFPCYGSSVWAYGHNLIFTDASGVNFTPEGEITPLEAADIETMTQLRSERRICLFSQERLDNINVDFDNPPGLENLTCLSMEEYSDNVNNLEI